MQKPNGTDVNDKSLQLKRLYRNGVHIGNFYYKVECWGMNSPKNEAEIQHRLGELINRLQTG